MLSNKFVWRLSWLPSIIFLLPGTQVALPLALNPFPTTRCICPLISRITANCQCPPRFVRWHFIFINRFCLFTEKNLMHFWPNNSQQITSIWQSHFDSTSGSWRCYIQLDFGEDGSVVEWSFKQHLDLMIKWHFFLTPNVPRGNGRDDFMMEPSLFCKVFISYCHL